MDNQTAYNTEAMLAGLSAPFSQDEIKSRPGPNGQQLRYVQPPSVIKRLNSAVGQWNLEVRKEWTDNGVTKALVRLEIPGLGYREHVGIQEQGGNQGADALAKGAVSDGLKKAASLFGIALDLYDDVPQQQWSSGPPQNPNNGGMAPQQQQGQFQNMQQVPQQQFRQQQGTSSPPPQQQQAQSFNQQQQQQNGPRRYNPQYEDGQMPSEAQGRKLWVETQRTGISDIQAAQAAGVHDYRGIDAMTKKQMSAMIDWLTFQPDGPGQVNQPRQQQPQGGPVYNDSGDQVLPDNYYEDVSMDSVPF